MVSGRGRLISVHEQTCFNQESADSVWPHFHSADTGDSPVSMPHKSKKEKESSKSGRSKKSGSKNGPSGDQEGANKKVPPATQLMRVKQPGSQSAMKREKRFSTSSFPLSANRELQKLPELAALQTGLGLSGFL